MLLALKDQIRRLTDELTNTERGARTSEAGWLGKSRLFMLGSLGQVLFGKSDRYLIGMEIFCQSGLTSFSGLCGLLIVEDSDLRTKAVEIAKLDLIQIGLPAFVTDDDLGADRQQVLVIVDGDIVVVDAY